MTSRLSSNIKCSRAKEHLAQRIRSGEFAFGSRFPSLNNLCKEYDLSYVTVCKAVKLLENEGFLRCQPGIGYFVCYSDSNDMADGKKVNLISTPGLYEHYQNRFDAGLELFKNAGWQVNLLLSWDLYDFKEEINTPDSFSIITAFNIDWKRFSATFGQITRKVAVLGRLSGNPEITSLVADEVASIRLCMEHFAAKGRKKIALFSLLPDSELGALRIAAWRSICRSYGLSVQWMREHLLTLRSDGEERFVENNRETITNWLAANLHDSDGLILPSPLNYAVDAIRQYGVSIPERLAVVAIGNRDGFLRNNPGIAALDNNYEGHFQYALDILEERFANGDSVPGAWYFCPPKGVVTNFADIV